MRMWSKAESRTTLHRSIDTGNSVRHRTLGKTPPQTAVCLSCGVMLKEAMMRSSSAVVVKAGTNLSAPDKSRMFPEICLAPAPGWLSCSRKSRSAPHQTGVRARGNQETYAT